MRNVLPIGVNKISLANISLIRGIHPCKDGQEDTDIRSN